MSDGVQEGPMGDDEERTEEATQQRREEFRKRGQVAQTRELASVFVLLTAAAMLWFLGRFFLQQVSEMVTESLGRFLVDAVRQGDFLPATIFVCKRGAFVLGPLVGILAIMSVASSRRSSRHHDQRRCALVQSR